jgi:hypothetical protein
MPSGPVPFSDSLEAGEAFNGIQQVILREAENVGADTSQPMWDVNRATGLNTLKHMIREYYSPQVKFAKQNVRAIVLEVNQTLPSSLDNNLYKGFKSDSGYVLGRVRVISDARHFWIPVPKKSDDAVIGLYPYVRSEEAISVGDIVEVNFNDEKYQFSGVSDVGVISKVVSKLYSTYTLTEIEQQRAPLPTKREKKLTKGGRLARKLQEIKRTLPTPYKKGQELLNDPRFIARVQELSRKVGVYPDAFIKVFEIECSMDPRAINTASGAVGLIQFMPDTAIELKTTSEDILRMDGIQQLDLVEKYFNLNRIKSRIDMVPPNQRGLDHIYLGVFYPAAVSKPDSFVMGSERSNDRYWIKKIAEQNSAYKNSRGVVTRGAILKRIRNKNYRYSLPR